MPLILIPIAWEYIIAFGAVVIAFVTYKWTLSRPKGWFTWTNCINWIDVNIKQPCETLFEEIQEGMTDFTDAFAGVKTAISAMYSDLKAQIRIIATSAAGTAIAVLAPSIGALETWRTNASAWLHNTIEARQNELFRWKESVSDWLHKTIEARINDLSISLDKILTLVTSVVLGRVATLETWRSSASNYIHNTIERNISNLETMVRDLPGTIKAFVAGQVLGLQEVINAQLRKVTDWVTDIYADIMVDITNWRNYRTEQKKSEKDLSDMLKYLDAIDLDPLLIAYYKMVGPTLVRNSSEILGALGSVSSIIISEAGKGGGEH